MINFNKLEIKNNTIIIDVSIKDESYYRDIYIDEILIDTQDTCINSGPSEKAISVYKDQENFVEGTISFGTSDVQEVQIEPPNIILPEALKGSTIRNLLFSISDNGEGHLMDGHLFQYPYELSIDDVDIEGVANNAQNNIKFTGSDIIINSGTMQLTAHKGSLIEDVTPHLAKSASESHNLPYQGSIDYYKSSFENLKNKHLELTSPVIQNVNSDLFFVYVKVKGTPSPDTPCGMDNSITGKALFNIQPIYKNIMNYVKELGNTCNVPYNLVDKSLQLKMLNICLQIGNNIEAADIWKKYFMDNITNEPINCNCNG